MARSSSTSGSRFARSWGLDVVPTMEDGAFEPLIRELAPQVLAAVLRQFNDFASAEDAVQEALVAAVAQWPRTGVPDNPRGWLIRVAHRRMVDQWRSDTARRRRENAVLDERFLAIPPSPDNEWPTGADDTLLLLFMCCHPALTSAAAIALTLRAVAGLTTSQIAKAFLVPDATIGQRISRAKERIRASGVQLAMPDATERSARLQSVLHVLY